MSEVRKLVTERHVLDAWRARRRELHVAADGVVTPAAADLARAHDIEIVRLPAPQPTPPTRVPAGRDKQVVIGSDHGGFELKETLKAYLHELGYQVEDVGTSSTESVDYPDFAFLVASRVARTPGLRGVIVDGAGIGSAMAANKVPGVRAAVCHDVYTARNSREHNHANVLTLGSQVLGAAEAKEVLKTWLETEPGGGRHQRRVDKITAIEARYTR